MNILFKKYLIHFLKQATYQHGARTHEPQDQESYALLIYALGTPE